MCGLQFAGLLAFTDAKLERMPDALRCNESRGQFSCFDGTCFNVEEMCDGVRQCVDGADELGCKYSVCTYTFKEYVKVI